MGSLPIFRDQNPHPSYLVSKIHILPCRDLTVHTRFCPLGNLKELFQEQVGYADFMWQEQYGNAVHIKATLGVSRARHISSRTERRLTVLLTRYFYEERCSVARRCQGPAAHISSVWV